MRLISITLIILALFAGCSAPENSGDQGLKEIFKDDFYIGVGISPKYYDGHNQKGIDLIKKEFNSVTIENAMKWEVIHPEPGVYDFEKADAFVEFAESNDLHSIGHVLVWHSQTPGWVFRDEDGNLLDREALLERLEDHISTAVGRYKGKLDGWDVVNEAITDSAGLMRESLWHQIIGEDYVAKAFEFANEADPDAELYYNDYSLPNPDKREGAYRLVKSIQDQGIRVTGIGMQGHYLLDFPSEKQLNDAIERFGELGKVAITELDLDILPSRYQGADVSASMDIEVNEDLNPYVDGLPDSANQVHADRYAMFFRTFLKHRDVINRVTFWNLTDGDSWKNNFPIRGRTNYPLIFDRDYERKLAYEAIVNEKLSMTE